MDWGSTGTTMPLIKIVNNKILGECWAAEKFLTECVACTKYVDCKKPTRKRSIKYDALIKDRDAARAYLIRMQNRISQFKP